MALNKSQAMQLLAPVTTDPKLLGLLKLAVGHMAEQEESKTRQADTNALWEVLEHLSVTVPVTKNDALLAPAFTSESLGKALTLAASNYAQTYSIGSSLFDSVERLRQAQRARGTK
jgi:hypothetical protein